MKSKIIYLSYLICDFGCPSDENRSKSLSSVDNSLSESYWSMLSSNLSFIIYFNLLTCENTKNFG